MIYDKPLDYSDITNIYDPTITNPGDLCKRSKQRFIMTILFILLILCVISFLFIGKIKIIFTKIFSFLKIELKKLNIFQMKEKIKQEEEEEEEKEKIDKIINQIKYL